MLWLIPLFLRALLGAVLQRALGRSLRQRWPFRMDVVTRFLTLHGRLIDRWPLPRARAQLERLAAPTDMTRRVQTAPAELTSPPATWVTPPDCDGLRTVLYLHGGGFSTARTAPTPTRWRASRSRAGRACSPPTTASPPSTPFPPPSRTPAPPTAGWRSRCRRDSVVAGDSSGANLALALLIDLRDRGEPLPAAAALHLRLVRSRRHAPLDAGRVRGGDWGELDGLLRAAGRYAGALPLDDPRVSPLYANLAGLPPLFVQVGAPEMVRDENLELAAKVRAAGGQADVNLVDHHPHSPILFAAWSPPARQATERLATWIRQHTPQPSPA